MSITKKARAGLVAGSAIAALSLSGVAGMTAANAADSATSPTPTASAQALQQHRGVHAQELTGATADGVKAAVLAKYPGAIVEHAVTDRDATGGYVAMVKKADGTHVAVVLDSAFAITGEKAAPKGDRGSNETHGPRAHQGAALTGATADSVKAAVLAKYPGATVDRMEQDIRDSSGYVAFITKTDGTHALVKVDASFAVTGDQVRPSGSKSKGHGHGHHQAQTSGATAG